MALETFLQFGDHAWIQLDRDHLLRHGQQLRRQIPRPWTNLLSIQRKEKRTKMKFLPREQYRWI